MNRLKELRQRTGIRQKELAEHLNTTQATLSNWESGKHDPDSKSLLTLADYFGVSTDYLLGKSDKTRPHSEVLPLTTDEFLASQGITKSEHIATLKNIMELMAKTDAEYDETLEKDLRLKHAN